MLIHIVGAPGAGKTSLLRAIGLRQEPNVWVIDWEQHEQYFKPWLNGIPRTWQWQIKEWERERLSGKGLGIEYLFDIPAITAAVAKAAARHMNVISGGMGHNWLELATSITWDRIIHLDRSDSEYDAKIQAKLRRWAPHQEAGALRTYRTIRAEAVARGWRTIHAAVTPLRAQADYVTGLLTGRTW